MQQHMDDLGIDGAFHAGSDHPIITWDMLRI